MQTFIAVVALIVMAMLASVRGNHYGILYSAPEGPPTYSAHMNHPPGLHFGGYPRENFAGYPREKFGGFSTNGFDTNTGRNQFEAGESHKYSPSDWILQAQSEHANRGVEDAQYRANYVPDKSGSKVNKTPKNPNAQISSALLASLLGTAG